MCTLGRCLTWCIIAVIGPVHAYFLCHLIGSRFFIRFARLMIRVSCIDNSVKCNHAAHQVNQCTSIILHQISSMILVSVKKHNLRRGIPFWKLAWKTPNQGLESSCCHCIVWPTPSSYSINSNHSYSINSNNSHSIDSSNSYY